jgi:hypothetical protein
MDNKHDKGKRQYTIFPVDALNEIVDAMAYGKEKYEGTNWKDGLSWDSLVNASLRHIYSFVSGESIDQESNISHLAHAAASLAMLLHLEGNKKPENDLLKVSAYLHHFLDENDNTSIRNQKHVDRFISKKRNEGKNVVFCNMPYPGKPEGIKVAAYCKEDREIFFYVYGERTLRAYGLLYDYGFREFEVTIDDYDDLTCEKWTAMGDQENCIVPEPYYLVLQWQEYQKANIHDMLDKHGCVYIA